MASSRRRKNKKLHEKGRKARSNFHVEGPPVRPRPRIVQQHHAPTEMDQMHIFIVEPDLGLHETTLAQLRSLAEALPFEGAMVHVALLGARLEPVLVSPEGQWKLAQWFYEAQPDLLVRYAEFKKKFPTRLMFSLQPIALLMRVLIDHAKEERLRELSEVEGAILRQAVLGAHSAFESKVEALPEPSTENILAYEVQAASFFHRPVPLETMVRHRELLRLAVTDERLRSSVNRVPVDEWLAAAGMTGEEQWKIGFALSALAEAFGESIEPRLQATTVDDALGELEFGEHSRELQVIAASREELGAEFAGFGGGDAVLAWEFRPFRRTPFLRLANGDLVLLGLPWLLSWLGEGFYYRPMAYGQQTQSAGTTQKFTSYMGEVVERYALDLAETAIKAPARVLGEQAYDDGGERLTSDVMVVWGADLILFEIHARRVAATAAITGSPAQATVEISKLLVKKVNQVGQCIAALLDGTARLPQTDIANVERIWPVVVAVGDVMQTRTLWKYVRATMDSAKTASFSNEKVQPLQFLGIEDYERVLGLIEAGQDLPEMLARKIQGAYRERDFAAWLAGDPGAPSNEVRLSILSTRWDQMGDEVQQAAKPPKDFSGERPER